MSKTKYLDNRCLWCDELLHASTHQSAKERKKRDAKKLFCGGPCKVKYQAKKQSIPMDAFLYAKPMEP